MDKNFIDIDTLVKQRLGGGEEQERSGSWQNMRELLDKEMPVDRPKGGFFGRRMFGALALLLLVGGAGVGGYKIVTSNNSDAQNTGGQITEASLSGTGSSPANSDELARKVAAPGATTTGATVPADGAGNGSNVNASTNEVAANNGVASGNKAYDRNGNDITNDPAARTAAVNDSRNSNTYGSDVTVNNHTVNNNNTTTNTTAGVSTHAKTNTATNTNGNSVAANVPSSKNGNANNTVAATSTTARHTGNTNNAMPAVVATNTPAANSRTAQGAPNASKTNNATAATTANPSVANRSMTNNTTPANTNTNSVAGNNKPANNNRAATASNNTGNDNARVISTDKMAVGSNTPATGNKNVVSSTTNNSGVPVFVTKNGKRIPGDKLQRLNTAKAKQNNNTATAASVDAMGSKRVIKKMRILERFVKTAPNGEGFYKMDTLSIVTLTEELGVITESKTTIAKPASGELNSDTRNKGMAARAANTGTRVFNSSVATSASNKSQATIAKKTSGALVLENLSAAFNDIKYHVAGTQFAGGITAGINGTFFGPGSFKGFQFGFIGRFIFSDKVSLQSELKYFHRINGNYSVNDNYYSYTDNGNGGYTRELQKSTYNFAALHSFELPVAISYTQGRINLMAGGNFSYGFAVNTGAATIADPASRTTVTNIGSDNTPKLSDRDFNSRFGVGYMFGASYQVSPKVTLDLRNVQTVWDNSRSSGAKSISNQLYRNPSFQFSFGYRLGGNRNRE